MTKTSPNVHNRWEATLLRTKLFQHLSKRSDKRQAEDEEKQAPRQNARPFRLWHHNEHQAGQEQQSECGDSNEPYEGSRQCGGDDAQDAIADHSSKISQAPNVRNGSKADLSAGSLNG